MNSPAIDLAALGVTFRLEALAVSHRQSLRGLPSDRVHAAWERRYHYRAVERSWSETQMLRSRMLALTGHARWVTMWRQAAMNARLYREAAEHCVMIGARFY